VLSRQKLVEAVPAERVRLKRKSNNEVTFHGSVRIVKVIQIKIIFLNSGKFRQKIDIYADCLLL
jgi:hypothetical protein